MYSEYIIYIYIYVFVCVFFSACLAWVIIISLIVSFLSTCQAIQCCRSSATVTILGTSYTYLWWMVMWVNEAFFTIHANAHNFCCRCWVFNDLSVGVLDRPLCQGDSSRMKYTDYASLSDSQLITFSSYSAVILLGGIILEVKIFLVQCGNREKKKKKHSRGSALDGGKCRRPSLTRPKQIMGSLTNEMEG